MLGSIVLKNGGMYPEIHPERTQRKRGIVPKALSGRKTKGEKNRLAANSECQMPNVQRGPGKEQGLPRKGKESSRNKCDYEI